MNRNSMSGCLKLGFAALAAWFGAGCGQFHGSSGVLINLLSTQRASENLASTAGRCNLTTGTEPSGDFDIIIVAGQSNAVGAGMGQGYDEPTLELQNNRLFQIARFGDCNGLVVPANPSLQFRLVGANWSYKGLGLPFARRYASLYLTAGRNVLIVPAAEGSTSILHWARHALTTGDGDPIDLYNDLLMRANIALSHPHSKIVAVLWNQGEGDIAVLDITDPKQRANAAGYYSVIPNGTAYSQLLKGMIDQLRTDLPQSGCVPFLIGESAPAWRRDRPSTMAVKSDLRNSQVKLAQSMRCVGYVESDGLTSNTEEFPSDPAAISEDNIHFSARALAAYGARYFASFTSIINSINVVPPAATGSWTAVTSCNGTTQVKTYSCQGGNGLCSARQPAGSSAANSPSCGDVAPRLSCTNLHLSSPPASALPSGVDPAVKQIYDDLLGGIGIYLDGAIYLTNAHQSQNYAYLSIRADLIHNSIEVKNFINSIYQSYLRRGMDDGDWVAVQTAYLNGATVQQMEQYIVQSQECHM